MVESISNEKVTDPLLASFLASSDEVEAEIILAKLMQEQAAPLCLKVVQTKLRVSLQPGDLTRKNQDALEVWHDTQVSLLAELRKLRQGPGGLIIGNLRSYIAGLAHHACYAYLRRAYPHRHRLKNKLRYLLTSQPQLAVWENKQHEMLTGLARWRGLDQAFRRSMELQKLYEDPTAVMEGLSLGANVADLPPVKMLVELYNFVGCPVEFDELVDIVAVIWQVRENHEVCVDDEEEGPTLGETLSDETVDIALELEQKAHLTRLWAELCQLPLGQRVALLLNLRDPQGRGVIELFLLTNTANFAQIAAALALSVPELAALWNDLPLDDAAIAGRLGVTRQQVINLRKSGRERLQRRTKDY